ncbi:hypothetical protein ACHAW6_008128 [Cyclotella cf. meneghiniana]
MESSQGKLTTRCYTAATAFVDRYSCLQYVHLMTSLASKETIKAKNAFERFAADHGVNIKQYHADNGCFADNAFKQHFLNLTTGLVSPQFHCKYDNFFETICYSDHDRIASSLKLHITLIVT